MPLASPVSDESATTAPRDLIVCCDGTNNTLTGGVEDTNVLLLYAYLLKHTDPARTRLFYDPGVGTPDAAPPTDLTDMVKRKVNRIAGLASGRGVYDNIAEAYRFLMTHWRSPADRIFCFGFSRGAFTARCVVGMVNMFGVIRPQHDTLLPTLIRIYFSQPAEDDQVVGRKNFSRRLTRILHKGFARPDKGGSETAQPSEESVMGSTRKRLAQQVRLSFGIDDIQRQACVHWVGVWDTVESVGLPVLFSRDNPASASFRDKPGMRHIRHALALDEHRVPFLPRVYDEPHELVMNDALGTKTLKQLWFPGVHCDVGGSYTIPTSGLADNAWLWMFNEVAPEFGLATLTALPAVGALPFDDFGMPRRAVFPSEHRLRHDALWDTPAWALAGMAVRRMDSERVATIGQMRQAKGAGRRAEAEGVLVDVKAADVPATPGAPSVWDARRKLWPMVLAIAVAAVGIVLSGSNLVDPTAPAAWQEMPAEACRFASQQLAAAVSPDWLPTPLAAAMHACGPVAARGLRDPEVWRFYLQPSPAWAVLWDFVAVAGLGYLLARLGSRGFTFLAGFSRPGQARRRWLGVLGTLPMTAVVLAASENAVMLLAVLLQRLETPLLVPLLLWLVGALALLKLVFYLASFGIFGTLRVYIAVVPGTRIGKVGRHGG